MWFPSVTYGGGLAQLGERLHGMQEVTGSSPVFSTIFLTCFPKFTYLVRAVQPTKLNWGNSILEKIRELVALLQAGIEEYDDQLKLLQKERLKFLRLSITDEFGVE